MVCAGPYAFPSPTEAVAIDVSDQRTGKIDFRIVFDMYFDDCPQTSESSIGGLGIVVLGAISNSDISAHSIYAGHGWLLTRGDHCLCLHTRDTASSEPRFMLQHNTNQSQGSRNL